MPPDDPESRLYVLELQQRPQGVLASRVLPFRGDVEALEQARTILSGLPQARAGAVTIGVGRKAGPGGVEWLGAWGMERGIARWRVRRSA